MSGPSTIRLAPLLDLAMGSVLAAQTLTYRS